ncbi:MFS transporter [Pseudomonas citronellolis]|uniref:MFS transporter n=1 Tax=Pseudomonas citronellolis TaxID=53408 RepID=UPI000778EE1A|nr:MFS transporter [Pseudomonas citronellolis]AMO76029.1 Major Facilitator Superfamily protein [Pseudomonas citronellolis]
MSAYSRGTMTFLLCSTLYRLASGALLVSLTWNILHQHSVSYLPLAVAIFCSFIPAFVTPALVRRLSLRMNGRQMSARFLGGLAVLGVIAGLSRYQTIALLLTNLIVWLLFLLLEASLDMWFTQVLRGLPEALVQRVSGATTASSQAALMIGPLLAAVLTPLLGNLGFAVLLAAIFLLVAAICYQAGGGADAPPAKVRQASTPALPLSLFIPLLLVWPTLGAFNFMLPVFVTQQGWDLFQLGVLDAAFGLGMALVGLLIITGASGPRLFAFLALLLLLSAASALAWLILPSQLAAKSLCLVVLGVAFGGARVHIRAAIAHRLEEAEVGQAVSRANALATPALLLILLAQFNALWLAWALPFALIALSIALLMQSTLQRSQPRAAANDAARAP